MLRPINIAAVILSVSMLAAQGLPPNPPSQQSPEVRIAGVAAQMEGQQDLNTLSRMFTTLREVTKATEEVKAQANQLADEARSLQDSGTNGEGRRSLAHAITLLLGKPWSEKQEFIASLGLRISTVIADSSLPVVGEIVQLYPVRSQGARGLRLRFSLAEALPGAPGLPGGPMGPPGAPAPNPKTIKEVLTCGVPSGGLTEEPFYFDIGLEGIPDGKYSIEAEVLDAVAVVFRLSAPVVFVLGLGARAVAVEQKLARIQGHDSAKATARFPFQLARAINAWRRDVPANVDFAKETQRSEELVKALESGQDPLFKAKGDHKRHYWFAEAGEIMPYRIYVPTAWDSTKKMPVVMILHGGGLNEDSAFERAPENLRGIVTKLAEQHGFIIVSPLGYRPSGGFGSNYGTTPNERPAGRWPGSTSSVADLSEKDALNILDLVSNEYNADRSRIYLVGNSMGGGGVWTLGSKYPRMFAAVAPCASSMNLKDLPFDRLKSVPVIAAVGAGDTDERKAVQRNGVTKLKELGGEATYIEVPGGQHTTAWYMVLDQIFNFFDRHHLKQN